MPQTAKQLADQINQALNDLDVPVAIRERAAVLSKILDIPKQQAWSLLEGNSLPDEALFKKIITEFEIDAPDDGENK